MLFIVANVMSEESEGGLVEVVFEKGIVVVCVDESTGSMPFPEIILDSSPSMIDDHFSIRAVPEKVEYGEIYLNGSPIGSEGVTFPTSIFQSGIHFEVFRNNYSIHFKNFDNNDLADPLTTLSNKSEYVIPVVTSEIAGQYLVAWNTEADGTGNDIVSGTYQMDLNFIRNNYTLSNSNLVLYPKWANTEYSFVFESNGGKGQLPSILSNRTIETGVTIPEISLLKNGYESFVWNTESDGNGLDLNPGINTIDDVFITRFFGNSTQLTLYPKWLEKNYSITFFSPDSSGAMPDPLINFKIGSLITISTGSFSRNGYDMNGWNTTEVSDGITISSGDYHVDSEFLSLLFGEETTLRLYPIWTVKTYLVTLETERGTITGEQWSEIGGRYSIDYNIESEDFSIPEPESYDKFHDFVCWEDENGRTVSSIVTGTYGDIPLRAVWKNRDYSVNLNVNGRTYEELFTIDDEIPDPDCEAGFEFKGWYYKDQEGNETQFTAMTQMYEGMSIYAVYEPIRDDPLMMAACALGLIVFFTAVMVYSFRKK